MPNEGCPNCCCCSYLSLFPIADVENTMKLVTYRFLFPLLIMLVNACGKYRITELKNYQFEVHTDDNELRDSTYRMMKVFNERLGSEVLKFAGPEQLSYDNFSQIKFTPGLRASEGKLGYGQWETMVESDPELKSIEGRKIDRVIAYKMNLEFDVEFFKERMEYPDDSAEFRELFLLFCHEVGHGLTQEHTDNRWDVMYPYIDGAEKTNFDEYFESVASFFDLNSN